MRNIFFIILSFFCLPIARAEFDPAFFQIGPTWKDNQKQKNEARMSGTYQDYGQGYQGDPIFDKDGKLVVFEGSNVPREVAEDYVKKYNKKN